MRIAGVIFCALLCVWVGGATAVELKETPVQSQLQAVLLQTAAPAISHGAGRSSYDNKLFGRSREDDGRKSVTRAAFYSALLPGLGEYYVGNRKKARYFFAAEAMSWLGFLAFRTYGDWKKDDYIHFAGEKAGASLEGKPDWFVDFVAFYDDIDQYNELARVLDRDRRPYLEDDASNHWRWKCREDKAAFRDIKNSSREAYRNADLTIGLMIVNRIVSVIDAIHDARRSGKRLDDLARAEGGKLEYRVEVNPFSNRCQIGLSMYTRF